MAKVVFKAGYSVSSKGLQDTIHQDNFSTKSSKFYENEQEEDCPHGGRIKGDVDKRESKENSNYLRGVSEKFISLRGQRRRLLPCNKSKNVEPDRSFSPFP